MVDETQEQAQSLKGKKGPYLFIASVVAAGLIIFFGLSYKNKIDDLLYKRRIKQIASSIGASIDEYTKEDIKLTKIETLVGYGIDPNGVRLIKTDPDLIREKVPSLYFIDRLNYTIQPQDDIERLVNRLTLEIRSNWPKYQKCREAGFGGFTMLVAEDCGLSLDDLLQCPNNTTMNDFDLFRVHGVPSKYFLPRLQQGQKSARDITEEYAVEMAGVSADVRRKYRAINMPSQYKGDKEIRFWADNGMIPDYLFEIARDGTNSVRTAFKLVEGDELNGKIFEKWYPEVSVDEMFFGIQHGYSPEDAVKANALGRTLMQYHIDLQYYNLLKSDLRNRVSQPVLNGAPK